MNDRPQGAAAWDHLEFKCPDAWHAFILVPPEQGETQNLKAKGFDFSHNVLCREHYDISQVRRSSEATSSCSEIIVFINSGGTMHISYDRDAA